MEGGGGSWLGGGGTNGGRSVSVGQELHDPLMHLVCVE